MKKLIGITLLSAVAMLAAPKAQSTTAPAPSKAATTKKVKKAHVKKAKAAVKPSASATPSK